MKYPRNRAFLGEGIAISKPLLRTNLKDLYFVSFYVKVQEKEVLEKSLFFPKKFCINHVSEREVTASAQETQTPEALTAVAKTSYIP